MRIGLAHDDIHGVPALRRLIESVPGYRVAWVAVTGTEAVEKCRQAPPDLVLVKLDLPVMDGVQATRLINQQTGCPVLIMTPGVSGHSGPVFEAMGHGALDVVKAPVAGEGGEVIGGRELLRKIAIIGRLIGEKPGEAPSISPRIPVEKPGTHLVAVGTSTGGPKALAAIFSGLPEGLDLSIVVVQHVDVQFARGFAEWLDAQTPLKVELAQEGSVPAAGRVLIAGTEEHLVLGPDRALHYTSEPRDYPYRPSVDTFFQSLQRNWPRKDTALLLTGMGRDGAKGLLALKEAGWHTIAQDEPTSTVFGMPKAAAECGAATEILPLSKIAGAVAGRVKRGRN
jgi:two-component system, chemotaxis family, response regulator WspF